MGKLPWEVGISTPKANMEPEKKKRLGKGKTCTNHQNLGSMLVFGGVKLKFFILKIGYFCTEMLRKTTFIYGGSRLIDDQFYEMVELV